MTCSPSTRMNQELSWSWSEAIPRLHILVRQENPYFDERIDPRDLYRVFVVEPQQSSERLRAQSGAFLVSAFHERFEREKIVGWNKGIPVYAHYKLTIPGKCKEDIIKALQMLSHHPRDHVPWA